MATTQLVIDNSVNEQDVLISGFASCIESPALEVSTNEVDQSVILYADTYGTLRFETPPTVAQIQFTPGQNRDSNNIITGSNFDDQIDADALAAANPYKGSQSVSVFFGSMPFYTLGGGDFSGNGTITFTAQQLLDLGNSGLKLWHGSSAVETSFTVNATDLISQADGPYTLYWIGSTAVPSSVSINVDREGINSYDDSITGNSGNDIIDGGLGNDWASYSDKTTGIAVTLNGTTNATVFVGGVAEDTIKNIENLSGGWGNDVLTGDGVDNFLRGNGGNDSINAGAGDDQIYGNSGNDTIDGGDGNDTVYFSGNVAEYTITHNVVLATYTITDSVSGRDGTDVVTSVENFLFADGSPIAQFGFGGYRFPTIKSGVLGVGDLLNPDRPGCYFDRYELVGVANDTTLAVYMGNSVFDNYLMVERNGSIIARNDDDGNGIDAFLTWSYMAGDVIRATTSTPGGSGAYNLYLSVSDSVDKVAPFFTGFKGVVGTTSEDSVVEITLGDLLVTSDAIDIDGSVDAFVIKSLSDGSLRIGANFASATPYNPGTNATIDATHYAYWIAAPNANGVLNAFSVVAKDNSGEESLDAIQAKVSVASVNDAATFSGSSFGRIIKDSGIYTAGGTLIVHDVDSATTITAQSDKSGTYGTFTIGADGVWAYTADPAKLALLGGTTPIVTDTFGVTTADGTMRNIVVTLMAHDVPGGTLLNGLGGAAGFGENYISRSDDSDVPNIDITRVFGTNGLNFLGTHYTTISINNNGNIIFGGSGLSAFTPWSMQTSTLPTIAAFLADVDTRGFTTSIIGPGAVTPTPGGNSKGSNLVWYDFDTTGYGVLTITWDDVGYFSLHTGKLNAFQMRLIGTGGGNFDVEFRYEDINWTTGDYSSGSNGVGGIVARAGYTAGNGITYYELPQSGMQEQMLALDTTEGNTGLAGLYYFSLSNGSSGTENQVIYGSDVSSILTGGPGNDTLYGMSGDDLLNGGAGADMLYGRAGNDLYFIDDTAESIVENANEGIDTVQASISYSLALLPNVENIRLVGSATINATGNGGDNTLISNNGSNIMDGGLGTDTASFELSRIAVVASLASNSATGDGTDTLISIENLTGSIYNDRLTGNANNNVLNGLNGIDVMTGLGGNDTIDGGVGDDTVVFRGYLADYSISFDGTGYTISDTVAGRDGLDNISGVEHFQFADGTRADILPPIITLSTPLDHATDVAAGSDIVLTFSEAIKRGTGVIEIHSGSATGAVIESYQVLTSPNIAVSGSTLTINPTADFAQGTHYFVTIAHGAITDLASNSYAGTAPYDFTTVEDASALHSLTGVVSFWKTGAAIAGVASALTSAPATVGTQLVDFKNIQTAVDGTRTIEIWENSTKTDISSLKLDFSFSTGSIATWQNAVTLPSGWSSIPNTEISGQFTLGGIGIIPLSAGPVKLGTLTLTAPANPQHFDLSLDSGELGNDTVPLYGITADSMTTGADGLYQYLDMSDSTYALRSAKVSGAAESNAIKANDALAALKISVGINPNADGSAVLPYQFLAADVNKDGQVRSADALNILKMAVHLPTAPEAEWLFVPDSVESEAMSRTHVVWPDNPIPVTLESDHELLLIGIVKGDVNGSWVA